MGYELKFEFMKYDPDDDTFRACECCDAIAPLHEFTSGIPEQKRVLCYLCSGTLASNTIFYPMNYTDTQSIMAQTICFIGNTILQKLDELKESITRHEQP